MKYVLAAFLSFPSLFAFSQQLFSPANYPQDYFRNPLDIPMSLAANFGELRPNHYHMGLDIRTLHRENLPVYAAADGYVARVEIEPAGFGQAIYICHPNGYTTVYGHLNQFFPALAAYVHEQQYRQQSWQVDLTIPPSLFPVKKGEFIAYSGSTGGSQGPHLHFEIRLTAGEINLNPLLFGLPVPDLKAPTFLRLAWYDRNRGIYEQSPHILPVRKDAAGWSVAPSLLTVSSSRISFALSAFDTQSGSTNPNGIYEADLYLDNNPVIGFRMDGISYNNTRNINAHIDYKTRQTGGPFLQQLFFLSGYPAPSIYRIPAAAGPADPAQAIMTGTRPADGVIDLRDERRHIIRIEVKDANGNASTLQFQVQFKAAAPSTTPGTPDTSVPPAAAGILTAPDSGKKFYPGMVDGLETEDYAFYLGEKSLYDSAVIGAAISGFPTDGYASTERMSYSYAIGAPWIPLMEPVLVRLKPRRAFDVDSIPAVGWVRLLDKIVMVCTNGSQKDVQRPEWDKDSSWASARFREFGSFQLVNDRTPPTITPLGPLMNADLSKASRIAFSIKDDLGAVRNFRAELDGAWLCFTNDKGLAYIYTFDEHCPPGKHTLKVTVEDVAGNRSMKTYTFTR